MSINLTMVNKLLFCSTFKIKKIVDIFFKRKKLSQYSTLGKI
jgi:hypothetical protein